MLTFAVQHSPGRRDDSTNGKAFDGVGRREGIGIISFASVSVSGSKVKSPAIAAHRFLLQIMTASSGCLLTRI